MAQRESTDAHHVRNVVGLQQHARAQAEAARARVEEAIDLLLKEGRPISFKAVAETAPCSTAWLYAHAEIKQRIIDLRARQVPTPQIVIPPRERASDASKDTLIAALRVKIKELRAENEELRKQLEVAYGLVHGRASDGRHK